MTTTSGVGRAVHPPASNHRLLIADTRAHQRVRVATWLERELARGAKVYYKGWPPVGEPRGHWLLAPGGPAAAAAAFGSGQLEMLAYPTVIERCGGTTEGLFQLQNDECERAVRQGWRSVAMTQETSHRPMVDDHEVAELVAQEGGYDALALRWPLTTLCQLTIDEENSSAASESVAVHHRSVVDVSWSSAQLGHRWTVRGALDAHVAVRFSAALRGALLAARLSEGPGVDLHIDLAAVEFMDFACAQILMINARSVSRDQRIVVYGATPFLRHLIVAAGRPRTMLFDDEVLA